jgi:outer membrane beta-barrel protein
MESRIRSLLLGLAGLCVLTAGMPAWSQDVAEPPEQVIEPNVERRDLDVSKIDTENFELTGFIGMMSVEDFETNPVYGLRFAYHISEALFAEAAIGRTEVGESSLENGIPGGGQFFDDRNLTYYDISLGWNILPGESFLGKKRAYNSAFYLIGGLGSTDFADDTNFTVNFGFGFKLLPTDFLAVRMEARSYLFDSELNAQEKTLNNMQGTLNISWFF